MKGVILAGGTGSRLGTLTKVTNKHLLPVGNEPMVCHPLRKLTGIGITDILLITSTDHMGSFISLLGDGSDYLCNLTYRVQQKAGGIAQALSLARDFVGDESCAVLLGDNIFKSPLPPVKDTGDSAYIFLKHVDMPGRFGVAYFDGGKIRDIVEKPSKPESNFAVTGIYYYPPSVFDHIERIAPSARGELEITDVNRQLLAENKLQYYILNEYWTDAGTFQSLHLANMLVSADSPIYTIN